MNEQITISLGGLESKETLLASHPNMTREEAEVIWNKKNECLKRVFEQEVKNQRNRDVEYVWRRDCQILAVKSIGA